MRSLEGKISQIGELVRRLQNIIFQLEYSGQVELGNGHIYLIAEDAKSYHPFRVIKRVNPEFIVKARVEDARLYISKGSPPEILLDFISDFDRLFVAVQKEKIKKYLLMEAAEDAGGGRLYENILLRAENLLDKYSDGEAVKDIIMKVSQREGFIPEMVVSESNTEAIKIDKTVVKKSPQAKKIKTSNPGATKKDKNTSTTKRRKQAS